MALPTTISSVFNLLEVPSFGPFLYSSSVYVVGVNSSSTNKLRAIKATDPTSSFSAVDDSNAPSTGTQIYRSSVCQVGSKIHVACIVYDATGMSPVYKLTYACFDCSTDSWDGAFTTIETITDVYWYRVSIAVRANGNIVIGYNGATDSIMGSAYSRVDYAIYTSSWSYGNAIDNGGEYNYGAWATQLGSSDRVHFFFFSDLLTYRQRCLRQNNALESYPAAFETSGSSAASRTPGSCIHTSGSDTIVSFFVGKSTQHGRYYFASADTPSVAYETVASTGSVYQSTGAADAANNLYALWIQGGGTSNIRIDPAPWGSPQTITTAVEAEGIWAKSYTRGGAEKIGILYGENGSSSTYYDEYALSTTSTWTVTGSGGISFAGTAGVLKQKVAVVSGGVAFAGNGGKARTWTPVVGGGITFGGAAATLKCSQWEVTAAGGIAFGGAPAYLKERVPPISGGISFAGTTDVLKEKSPTAAGGITFAGEAACSFTGSQTWEVTGSGGIAFAGQAGIAQVVLHEYAGSGGLVFSGTAGVMREKVPVVAGGVLFAGAATTARLVVREYSASGGIAFAGDAGLIKLKLYAPAGGIAFAGSADVARLIVHSYDASGGITFAGAASTQKEKVYTPAGGITFGGDGAAQFVSAGAHEWTGTGGIAFAGDAGLVVEKVPVPAGGLMLGGAATIERIVNYEYMPSGGIAFAGTADTSYLTIWTVTASGGIAFDGSGSPLKERVPVVAGGVVFAGTATTSHLTIWSVTPAGGLILAGSADTLKEKIPAVAGGIIFAGDASCSFTSGVSKFYPSSVVDAGTYTRETGSSDPADLIDGVEASDTYYDRSVTRPDSTTLKFSFSALNTRPGVALVYEYGKDEAAGERIDQVIQLRKAGNLVREASHDDVGVRPQNGNMDLSDLTLVGTYEVWLMDTEVV